MEEEPWPPLLSVSELFDAQAARATYERLVGVINAQASALERLTRRVATLEATQRHAVAAQQLALRQSDAMAAQLEALGTAQAHTEAAQRGQQARLDEVVLVVSRDAKRLESITDQVAHCENTIRTTEETLRQEMAPMDLVTRFHEAQEAMYDRVAAMDVRLDGKLDKSELTRLDGVVGKIQAFAPTATQLAARVGTIEAANQNMSQRLEDEVERANQSRRDIDQLQQALKNTIDEQTWREFKESTFETTVNQIQTDTETTSSVVNELVLRCVSLETSQRTLSSKLASVTAAISAELEAMRVETTAEMEKKMDHGQVDQSFKEIHHELNCKAWRKDTQAMQDDLAHLMAKFDKMVQQVSLTTRFLDWYATRGESYERNLSVVESQLERLAHESAPQLRQPFGNQIRYSE